MSRDWVAAYVSTLRKPKYRRLTIPAKAALFHIWLLAGGQDPEATWSRPELEEMLILDGWTDAGDRQVFDSAQGVVDELVAAGWLEVDDRDRVLVHDWDQWQLAATNATRRAYERDRKRDWRRAKPGADPGESVDPLPPAPPSPDITGSTQGHNNTVSPNVPKRPGHVRDTPRATVPSEGPCRVCGVHLQDTDGRVGPGWIEHVAHPPKLAGIAS